MSNQSVTLKAKGLSVHSNPLGGVSEGSMAEALNVVIDRNDVIEPRRGFSQYGNIFGIGSDRTKQLFNYKDRILRHVTNKLQFDSDEQGLFLNINGLPVTETQSGLRIKAIEANGNFYFVSSTGVKKLSARVVSDLLTSEIEAAGGIKALTIGASTNFTSLGFLSANSKVGYRVVFGVKDLNENLILGTPSARAVVYNVTSDSSNVDLVFTLPAEIVSTKYFYQVYRTGVFSELPGNEAPDPGDEMFLVLEDNVTTAQLTAGFVSLTDITPEDFRKNGTLLYTNPASGDGIEQSNEKPPFGNDIALYKGYTFLSNTKTVHRLNVSFLSIQGITNGTSTFQITNGITSNNYTFQGNFETYTVNFGTTVHSDYVNLTPNTAKYFTLTSSSDQRKYAIYYKETVNDQAPILSGYVNIQVPILVADSVSTIITKTINAIDVACADFNITQSGLILTIECANNGKVNTVPSENITNVSFVISKNGVGIGEDATTKKIFLPKIPTGVQNGPTTAQQLEQVAKSMEKVVNASDNLVYCYYQSGFQDIPGQLLFENRQTTGAQFSIISNVGSQFNPTLPSSLVSGNQVSSSNEVRPNRIHFSKYQQPEAFPLANYIDVGPKDREIKRIIPLRDSLFIFKEDGIYRLSGDIAPFAIAPFDFSAQVLAPDSAVVLNNQIYALSTQGVIVVTDTGVSVISRPIENLILKMIKQCVNYKSASFGISYESERSFLLWIPTNPNDTVSTQCFRYNTFTNSWTKWDNSKTCGIVNFSDDKLYLGPGDINFIEKERKSLTRIDHADRQYDLTVGLDGVNSNILDINVISRIEVGDVMIQTQYLTLAQFNRLLIKLDNDLTVSDSNYFSTLEMKPGIDIRAQLNSLSLKLDNDPGLVFNGYQGLIQSHSANILSIVPSGSQTIITTTTNHGIIAGRYVSFVSTNSTPDINGSYQIQSVTANTLTINKTIAYAGTTGILQTNINNFIDVQACFNLIVTTLNNDNGAFYSNYDTSDGNIDFEAVVLEIDKSTHKITTRDNLPLFSGDIVLYKAIKTLVTWNPQFFQDPTVEKQVTQGTMMFENSNFSKFVISYSTDLSPSFEETEFNGAGLGDWGQFGFGGINWGGVGAPVPLRTFIPLEKQRCRFIYVRFEHKVAFEKYNVFGVSLTYRPYNTKAYR